MKRGKRKKKSKAMKQFLIRLRSPLVLASIVAVLILVAGAIYVTLAYLSVHKSTTKTDTGLVDSKVIQQGLVNANNTARTEYNLHDSAGKALDEQQVKLVK